MIIIIPFSFEEKQVRVILDEQNNPWFNAGDVCAVLGYVNSRDAIAKHVDEDDVAKRDIIDSLGRFQQTNHLNESGLYALIFGSTKEEAKRFKRWVTSEVLPSIRKTGSYATQTAPAKTGQHRLIEPTRLACISDLVFLRDGIPVTSSTIIARETKTQHSDGYSVKKLLPLGTTLENVARSG
ncbi:MAG: Bro-N domain-containing protein [Magnetococcales bacterium]|nr:Bro-N domain-containing protein [Magnetococcales bacterium]